jgi:hypothetical protein
LDALFNVSEDIHGRDQDPVVAIERPVEIDMYCGPLNKNVNGRA